MSELPCNPGAMFDVQGSSGLRWYIVVMFADARLILLNVEIVEIVEIVEETMKESRFLML